jgi:hypothetical protein
LYDRDHGGDGRGGHQTESDNVSDTTLVQLTDAADAALGAFDFTAHEGKGIRVFIQGFG